MIFNVMPSPVGPLLLAADAQGLRLVEFDSPRHPMGRTDDWREGRSKVLDDSRRQFDDYFAGKLKNFTVPVRPEGTAFQVSAWRALQNIPYGATRSYGEQAKAIGKPKAVRAIGAANGRNPIPIIIPCHRVIGADGSLTGFGGGLPTKRFLLELEGAIGIADLFGNP